MCPDNNNLTFMKANIDKKLYERPRMTVVELQHMGLLMYSGKGSASLSSYSNDDDDAWSGSGSGSGSSISGWTNSGANPW